MNEMEERMNRTVKTFIALLVVLTLSISFAYADTYTVGSGDMLWKISKETGVSVDRLVELNGIDNPNLIHPGQVLRLGEASATDAKYFIMLIGDGLGFSQRQITEYFQQSQIKDQKLRMNALPVSGVNTTYSSNSLITDSAAAGTALACGVKTDNGVIGKNASLQDVPTLVELAEAKGMATGIISTTRLTHATPASFASHNVNRDNENEIAYDFLDSGVDFFAGGGLRHFIPQNHPKDAKDYMGATIKSKRTDDVDVVSEFEALGYKTFTGKEGTDAFKAADFSAGDQVLALFTYSHMPYEIDRANLYSDLPSLADMTAKGIDLLEEDKDGFFLMVEGGRIDHAAHQNDAAGMVWDTLAFDAAVEEAYDFYLEHPQDTLVLIVGDHETGGLGLGMDTQGYFVDPSQLGEAKLSIADELSYGSIQYSGDRETYFATIGEKLGLDDLSATEKAKLESAMDASDAGETYGYYQYDPTAVAVAHIQSERANIFWTTTIHTGTAIPLSAVGYKAGDFLGYKDNTEIAQALAEIMGVTLAK